jgi:mercuric ion binding protein
MKAFKLTLLALLGFIFSATAQAKVQDKAVISTPSIQCDMCKKKIETYLMRQNGIKAVKVDVKKKITAVQWITDRTNIEEIKTMIANIGYDADDVAAEETAYKRLPPCCKKPAVEVKAP